MNLLEIHKYNIHVLNVQIHNSVKFYKGIFAFTIDSIRHWFV